MREHMESVLVALGDALHGAGRHLAPTEPRRRRPRMARSTYVPVRRDGTSVRFAH